MTDEPIWTRLRRIADRLERQEAAGENVAWVFFKDFYPKTDSSVLCLDAGEFPEMPPAVWARNCLALFKDQLAQVH